MTAGGGTERAALRKFLAGAKNGAITIDELGPMLEGMGEAVVAACEAGLFSGAQAARVILVRATPTNTGQLRNAWQVVRTPVVQVYNEAPHAGIVERGARPHAVSAAGIAAIALWAKRKLGLSDKEAASVAWAVATKLKRDGQKPTYFVRNQLPAITKVTRSEVERMLWAVAKAGQASGGADT